MIKPNLVIKNYILHITYNIYQNVCVCVVRLNENKKIKLYLLIFIKKIEKLRKQLIDGQVYYVSSQE